MGHVYRTSKVEITIDDYVFHKLCTYKQLSTDIPESGGLILGRTDIHGNTRIIDITTPMEKDIRSRIGFRRRDIMHLMVLNNANTKCLYFKGNWHTHPQDYPAPSCIDKVSWKNAIKNSKPGDSEYIFFIIVGVEELRVWCGDMGAHIIQQMEVCRGEEYEV